MKDIKVLRQQINDIDKKMIELFVERMNVVKEILEYKIENNLPITDELREKELIEKNIKELNNKELEEYYQIFFEGVLSSSKKYQGDKK